MKKYFLICLYSISTLFASDLKEKFVIGTFKNEGFFSSFIAVLSNLMWADKNQKTPVVYWDQTSLFYQENGYNGFSNPWEYYFSPVSHLKYEAGDPIHSFGSDPDNNWILSSFFQNRDYFYQTHRQDVKKIIDKYIHIHPHILQAVEKFYQKHMAGKINIGIHLRGTDRNLKTIPNKMVETHLFQAKEIGKKYKKVQYFIATDEQSLLDFAKSKLKKKTIYCDSYRSTNGQPIHVLENQECTQKAKLGEEVLIEALLLAKCDYLIHSLSSVPLAVLFFNPYLKNLYLEPYQWMDFSR